MIGSHGWEWGPLLVSVSCFLMAVHEVAGRPSTQCAQLGQNRHILWGGKYNPTYTIGAENFTLIPEDLVQLGYSRSVDSNQVVEETTCDDHGGFPALEKHETDFCPKEVDIRTYLVRQNGRTLRGWLHVVIELNNLTWEGTEMNFVYVQFRDEWFSPMGEFITNPAHQCKNPKPDSDKLVQPTQYQIYPCGATGAREEKTATALLVAKHSRYVNKFVTNPGNGVQYVTSTDLKRGIYMTWRLSEYWCSRHERFRIDAEIGVTSRRQVLRKVSNYWMSTIWYGAADIVTGEEPLDCTHPAIDYSTGVVTTEALNWIRPKAEKLTYKNDITNNKLQVSGLVTGCQLKHFRQDTANEYGKRNYVSVIPVFGGRCLNHLDKYPNRSQYQSCNNDTKSPALVGLNFTTYLDYTFNLTQGRLKQCNQTCVEPDPKNETHLLQITEFPKRLDNRSEPKPRVSVHTLKEARADSRNSTFWQTRKFHGNLCVFVAMFLIPVSNFIARYYKETFLTHYHTVPAWLWSHGTTGYFVLTLIRCSYTAMRENINNWGQSTDPSGQWHRWLGYTFIVIYTLMSTVGGVRVLKNPCKVASVIAHAVTGSLLYVMAMYLVISSHNIPGSPSAKCHNETKLPEGTSQTAIYAYIWIGLDINFHVLMTIWQIMLDKREQIRRPGGLMAFPFLPMMQPKDRRNFVGATARKIVLVVYATVALTMTFLIIAGMFVDDDHGRCDLGNLTCNNDEFPFGCSPISKKYFKIITTERYNVTDLKDFEK